MSEDISRDRLRYVVAAGELGMFGTEDTPSSTTPAAAPAPPDGAWRALEGATAWLNVPPLTATDLRGGVVLVDFWTYTCINWLRTLPYIRTWAERYQDQGLVVIGVHAPEFPFEHDLENVRRAAEAMRITYPIALDNTFAIWRAFDNHYWPALYLVDATGQIRYHTFGEGDYERSERMVQQLLAEAGLDDLGQGLAAVEASGIEAAADWDNLESPETYLGYERTERFASAGDLAVGVRQVYTAPARLRLNQWALAGEWTVGPGAAELHAANGRIASRFHARDLHLVMGPAARGSSVRFRVLVDGQPPRAAHGLDVDDQGSGRVTDPRLYQLIRQPAPIADRLFEIEFLDAGVAAFAFTFG
jgi:thiol-disulfide isomerase/thioredoxin